jgi:regulator of replication initiation timing
MSDTAETLKRKLAQQIDEAKEKLDMLKRDIGSMHDEDADGLSLRRSEIRARIDQQKSHAQQLQDKITNWKNEKKAHTIDAIAAWQEQREIEKLQKRADRAEDYALDMVTIAANDFEEAEQAIFEAIAARREAEQSLTPSLR